jgi:hypothetical protein
MNFDELKQFINEKMQMQHVYQPVMIKTLLELGNKASVREIAESFLKLDESQIDYYKVITNQMPGRILKDHGVVSKEPNGGYSLNTSDLNAAQKSELMSLCETKIQNYTKKDIKYQVGNRIYKILFIIYNF